MKYALPLFAACSLTVLVWASCSPQDSTMDHDNSGYGSTPVTSEDGSADSVTYNHNGAADTLNPTLHPMPTRPDSSNRMPPHQ